MYLIEVSTAAGQPVLGFVGTSAASNPAPIVDAGAVSEEGWERNVVLAHAIENVITFPLEPEDVADDDLECGPPFPQFPNE